MNRCHSKVTEWGLKHISIQNRDTIPDVGCGGGMTVARLVAIAREGKTYGIGYSEESVAASRRANRKWIAAGRVEVLLGSVSHLPFPDRMLDLVTAVKTHYRKPTKVVNTIDCSKGSKNCGDDELRAPECPQVFEEYGKGWICAVGISLTLSTTCYNMVSCRFPRSTLS